MAEYFVLLYLTRFKVFSAESNTPSATRPTTADIQRKLFKKAGKDCGGGSEVDEVARGAGVDVARVDQAFLFLMPTAFVVYNVTYWSVVLALR